MPAHADARARLAAVLPRLGATSSAAERVLAVHPALAGVLPEGVMRGTTLHCAGRAASSLAALVAAGPVAAGAWAAVLGVPTLSAAAWHETGVALHRVVQVREPRAAPFDEGRWAQVLAAAIDGFDVVVADVVHRLQPVTIRRVQARAQARGVVLVVIGRLGGAVADLQLTATGDWRGLGRGHGHLQVRRVALELAGRRLPRARRDTIWLPGPGGQIERVDTEQVALHRAVG